MDELAKVYKLSDYRKRDIQTCPYCGEKVDRTDWKDTLSWTCAEQPGPDRHQPLRAGWWLERNN